MSTDTGYKTVAIIATLSLLLLLGYLIDRQSGFATRFIESLKGHSSAQEVVESNQPLSLPELVKKIKPSVVEIGTYNSDGARDGVGSGFFTGPQRVLSNWHVIEGSYRAEIKTADGNVYPVKGILAWDKEVDLVMLEIEITPNKVPALELSSIPPDEGERIVVIGNPLGLEGTVSDGIVSAVRDVPDFGRMLQITAPVSHGSSGGPVINMKGQVIGMMRGLLKEGQNLNFAVPGDEVANLQPGPLLSFTELHHREAVPLYNRALSLAHDGSCDSAIPLFTQAVTEDPDYGDAWLQLGVCWEEASSYEAAVDAFKQVLRTNPRSDLAYYQLGRLSAKLEMWDVALKYYRQSITLNPRNEDAQYELVVGLCKAGDYQEAQLVYRRLARSNPQRGQELYEVYSEVLTPSVQSGNEAGSATITLDIDPTTGLIAVESCPEIRTKTFIIGQEPKKYCGPEYHKQITARPFRSRVVGNPQP